MGFILILIVKVGPSSRFELDWYIWIPPLKRSIGFIPTSILNCRSLIAIISDGNVRPKNTGDPEIEKTSGSLSQMPGSGLFLLYWVESDTVSVENPMSVITLGRESPDGHISKALIIDANLTSDMSVKRQLLPGSLMLMRS